MGEPSCARRSVHIEPEPSFSRCLSVAFTSFMDSDQPSHRDEALESQGQRAPGWPGPSRGSCQRGRRCLQAVFAAALFLLSAWLRLPGQRAQSWLPARWDWGQTPLQHSPH